MYAEERQQWIVARARSAGRVEVTGLAADLDVTTETVRRDLTALERAGLLRRVHGGAIPLDRLGFEPGISTRDASFTGEKERIAKRALDEVPDEGTVLLDAGTTTARLAAVLPVDRELTVVTNSLPIATTLTARRNITLLLLGGRVRARTQATVDDWALRSLERLYVDVAFLGTNGISVGRGLSTPDPTEAGIKAAMITASRRSVLLADHSKLGTDHFARFGSVEDLDLIITDSDAESGLVDELRAAGTEVEAV